MHTHKAVLATVAVGPTTPRPSTIETAGMLPNQPNRRTVARRITRLFLTGSMIMIVMRSLSRISRDRCRRRRTVSLLAVALLVAALGGTVAAATPEVDRAIAHTDAGAVRGIVATDHRTFSGLPFAAPLGDLRWRSPQPAAAWSEIRDATLPGSMRPARLVRRQSGAEAARTACTSMSRLPRRLRPAVAGCRSWCGSPAAASSRAPETSTIPRG
jgi:hypothetical protein